MGWMLLVKGLIGIVRGRGRTKSQVEKHELSGTAAWWIGLAIVGLLEGDLRVHFLFLLGFGYAAMELRCNWDVRLVFGPGKCGGWRDRESGVTGLAFGDDVGGTRGEAGGWMQRCKRVVA